ncbi:hypothetical protein [Parvibium lacunae]|uniref:Uncharacterized protein n=1 Tax=Parvibium lacunae TaxID=1888893 RepID=A0A368L000_9BURK|nr:hypothetical protein [Parvibium lacunae]RCS56742.1 hypothetical protein DU000_10345 [Parvibium lacunae]
MAQLTNALTKFFKKTLFLIGSAMIGLVTISAILISQKKSSFSNFCDGILISSTLENVLAIANKNEYIVFNFIDSKSKLMILNQSSVFGRYQCTVTFSDDRRVVTKSLMAAD